MAELIHYDMKLNMRIRLILDIHLHHNLKHFRFFLTPYPMSYKYMDQKRIEKRKASVDSYLKLIFYWWNPDQKQLYMTSDLLQGHKTTETAQWAGNVSTSPFVSLFHSWKILLRTRSRWINAIFNLIFASPMVQSLIIMVHSWGADGKLYCAI